jgi:prepilin-type N-terminal cleavage/methylation domain-containing protein
MSNLVKMKKKFWLSDFTLISEACKAKCFIRTSLRKNLVNVQQGFTLIEILVVIAIIGILSTILIVSVNPGRQLARARDSQRKTDLVAILAGILQYSSEHSGDLPDTDGDPDTSNFPGVPTCIGTNLGCFDLANAGEVGEELVPVYMVAMPHDPKTGTPPGDTGYTIYVDVNGRLHAAAVGEIENPITADR